MGFPRVISKNNKIYTKLGEFCLSCDGSNFWIICHTCQEELQTQDHFWKHIQDEHNFLHNLAKENHRNNFLDTSTESNILPLPLYRKMSQDEPRVETENDEDSHEEQADKDYAEMRAIDPTVEIDIKEEPTIGHNSVPPVSQTFVDPQHIQSYATVVHSLPSTLTSVPPLAPLGPPPLICATNMFHNELQQQQQQQQQSTVKDSGGNSTTASASSAVSSDDGERWFVCEHESCGLKFKYQSRLELHRSVHSKERRFSCDMCGASFKQSCNLSTHRRKKHFLKGAKSNVNVTLPVLPSEQLRY